MSIRILTDACIGCGRCMDICPGNLLERDAQGHAFLRFPEDCWACASCVKTCPREAVALLLPPSAGSGETLQARELPERNTPTRRPSDDVPYGYEWIFTDAEGRTRTLTTHAGEANRY